MSDTDYLPLIKHGQGRDDDMDGGGVIAWAVVLLCLVLAVVAYACIRQGLAP